MKRLFERLHRAHTLMLRLHNRRTREAIGVSTLELTALWVCRGPQTASAIAKQLHIDQGAATRLVDQLVRKELLTRETDPTDRRRKVITRTEQGTALASEGSHLVKLANDDLRGSFSDEELEVVARFLDHLIARAEAP